MKRQVLEEMIQRHGEAKAEGDAYHLPTELEVSLYAGMGGIEPLIIDRVASVLFETEAVVVVTRRKERYLFAYEDVRAMRVSPADAGPGY